MVFLARPCPLCHFACTHRQNMSCTAGSAWRHSDALAHPSLISQLAVIIRASGCRLCVLLGCRHSGCLLAHSHGPRLTFDFPRASLAVCLTDQCRSTGHDGGRDAVGPPGGRVRAARGLLWHGCIHICVRGGQRGVPELCGTTLLKPIRTRFSGPPRWLDLRWSTSVAAAWLNVCGLARACWHSRVVSKVAASPSEALPPCLQSLWHVQVSMQDCCGMVWHI